MVRKLALSLMVVGLIALTGTVLPVSAVAGPQAATLASDGSIIFGTVWDVCHNQPGLDAEVYIAAGALDGAVALNDFQAVRTEVALAAAGLSPEALAQIQQGADWSQLSAVQGLEAYVAAWSAYYQGTVQGVAPAYVMTADGNGNYGVTGIPAGSYTVWLNLPQGWTPLQTPLVVPVTGGDSVRVDLNYCGTMVSGLIPLLPQSGGAAVAGPFGAATVGLLLVLGAAGLVMVARRRRL